MTESFRVLRNADENILCFPFRNIDGMHWGEAEELSSKVDKEKNYKNRAEIINYKESCHQESKRGQRRTGPWEKGLTSASRYH